MLSFESPLHSPRGRRAGGASSFTSDLTNRALRGSTGVSSPSPCSVGHIVAPCPQDGLTRCPYSRVRARTDCTQSQRLSTVGPNAREKLEVPALWYHTHPDQWHSAEPSQQRVCGGGPGELSAQKKDFFKNAVHVRSQG